MSHVEIKDLKLIKKHYGEGMMHLCRKLFPTIIETPDLLFSLLENNFAYSKFLYKDIIDNSLVVNFKNYIYSLVGNETKLVETTKNPKLLLNDVNYDFYECKTETDIQSFIKYYKIDEQLCTFKGNRLDNCYVFFVVKKNVDEIKRENFPNPKRQDEYGTSVISIQFSKGSVNTLSIKNRYNHTVNNPDATFGNNLENIIPGLTRSFENTYNLNINQNDNKLDLINYGYIKANNSKYYKYNYEINNVYYCPNNVIIDNGEVKKYEPKERYLVLDYFIIDLKEKTIKLYDTNIEDSFIDTFNKIKNINISKDKTTKEKTITISYNDDNQAIIKLNKYNQIINYSNDSIKKIGDYFLYYNETLTEINLPNIKSIGDNFLYHNEVITELNPLKLIKNIIFSFHSKKRYNTQIESNNNKRRR